MAAIKWSRVYYGMIATPLTERDAFIGHQLFVVTRVSCRRPLPRHHRRLRCSLPWLGLLVVPVAVLIGAAFSMPMAAVSASVENDRPSSRSSAS